jgi:isocitrate dehydrogenase
MLLDYLGWKEAAKLVEDAYGRVVAGKTVTYDFARQMEGAREVGTSEFAEALVAAMG